MKKNLIFILIAVVAIAGCKRQNGTDDKNLVDKAKYGFNTSWPDQPKQGFICFGVDRYNSGNSSKTYTLIGRIYPDTAEVDSLSFDGGNISVGSLVANSDANNYFLYGGPLPSSDSITAQSYFGTNSTFTLAGSLSNNVDAFSLQMYIPHEIKLNLPKPCKNGISKSQDLVIEWNQDAGNSNDVYIIFAYDGPSSHAKNSSLSATSIILKYGVSDNGTYTIPSSDFSSFPVDGDVYIHVMRGNSSYFYTTNHNQPYQIIGYSSARHDDYITN